MTRTILGIVIAMLLCYVVSLKLALIIVMFTVGDYIACSILSTSGDKIEQLKHKYVKN